MIIIHPVSAGSVIPSIELNILEKNIYLLIKHILYTYFHMMMSL